MLAAGVDRIIVINTMLASPPGKPANRAMRFFSWMPGTMGRGASEQQALVDALGTVASLDACPSGSQLSGEERGPRGLS
jgi:hypothetical protein